MALVGCCGWVLVAPWLSSFPRASRWWRFQDCRVWDTSRGRRVAVLREGVTHWHAWGIVRSGFAQIGGASGVGVWPVAHMGIHKRLTVLEYASNAIRTKDTPAGGRVVFWHKRLSFLWVVAVAYYACILSLIRQDQGSVRPPDLRTCPLAKEKKKIPLWPSAGPMVR